VNIHGLLLTERFHCGYLELQCYTVTNLSIIDIIMQSLVLLFQLD